ncbi:MAG TPA: NHLP bacteriocin export ABC transporter permease/ATPase subunit [Legionella sp.]|nr:NHLP bacteriocin export ABC transporter permease/ATPase subunit [Legionella sp.]
MDDISLTQDLPTREFNLLAIDHHYQISAGSVDVFLVRTNGKQAGRRYLIGEWQTGELLLGLAAATDIKDVELIASCSSNATLINHDWHQLCQSQYTAALKKWKSHFTSHLEPFKISYLETMVPNELANPEQLRGYILDFFTNILPLVLQSISLAQEREIHNIGLRKANENNLLKRAYINMLGTLQGDAPNAPSDSLNSLSSCVAIAAHYYDLPFTPASIESPQDIVQYTGMQVREIELKGNWWRGAVNPILLRKKEGERFCLALPKVTRGFVLLDPEDESEETLTHENAALFYPDALQLYCPLPQKKLKIRDLISFAFRGCQRDLLRLIVVGSLAAILSLVTPWFTGIVFDQIVPSGNVSQLKQISAALLIAAFTASLFELVRSITILRIGSRLNLNLEVGIWDRLIRLPVSFFRKFSTGDLVQRAMAASSVRNIMAGVVINSLLSGIFSIFSFGLLFYYDVALALTATIMVFIISAYTLIISIKQFSLYQLIVSLSGELSGLMLQLIGGVGKIQTSGREKTAFSLWAIKNSQIKKESYKANWYNSLLSSLNALSLPILTVIIFAQFVNRDNQMGLGVFLAFNAALGQFTAGMLGLTNSISTVINSIPLMKRTTPIIESLPEVHTGKKDPGNLKGKIEVEQLRFSYLSKEQPVIQEVSFVIEPGQYVAITGASGSGKSTLLRLLLGFEQADQGNIFFDDHDMKQLNVQRVREQCGVVLQSSFLMSGTLFENITGSSFLTHEEAWEAAEQAGLAEDISKMPMGMHTIVSEKGGSLSGGQRQRVLIARALAKKPKILFFDEATSSLDNMTQSIVIQSLEQLNATRVVIAHRLSTIEKADLILVMQQGKIVQSGTYSQLMEEEGLFQTMATRQLFE